MKRRVVSQISEYHDPKAIYTLITHKTWPYSPLFSDYAIRDRAMMSLTYGSGGRITAVVGGPKYAGSWPNLEIIEEYEGLSRDNLEVTDDLILVKQMDVVKRTAKLVKKYGRHVAIRDDFVLPLKPGLYDNPYWDQLIPFGWLVVEYLRTHAPKEGPLFRFERHRAWQIIKEVTKYFCHWFRAQAEHFYGHYLITDSVKLAKFLKVVRPEQTARYIGYSWKDQLKNPRLMMDFDWIGDEVEKIKERLE